MRAGQQVYTGLYTFEGDDFRVLCQEKAVGIEEIVQEINAMGKPVVFLGDGVPVHKTYIEEHIQVPCSFAPPHLNAQRAGAWRLLGNYILRQAVWRRRMNTCRNIYVCLRRNVN